MFKQNKKQFQAKLFGMTHVFPIGVSKRLESSWAPVFRKLIFEKIDERRYAELYSTIDSRPNFPVNIWVSLEILKWMRDFSDQELLDQFHFDLLTAHAVGLDDLGETTMAERTLNYNRKRLLDFEARTGRNLLDEEFNRLTDEALSKLKINTKLQRMDSSFVGSFIKQMSRLELIAKVLQNFYRDLSEAEKIRWQSKLGLYIEDEAEHISYQLKRAEVEEHLEKLGILLLELHQAYADDASVNSLTSYHHVSRILLEQFNVRMDSGKTTIEVKPAKEISSASLQNPADDTATFREKNGKIYKGDIFNIAETCDPENPVQLITDTSVYPNMVADDVILTERIPEIKERTAVKEMITDGNYSGEKSEQACSKENVVLIPTEVKGRKLSSDKLSLTEFHFDGNTITACPEGHSPIGTKQCEDGHYIVYFAREHCAGCSRRTNCLIRFGKLRCSLIYNDRQVILSHRRQQLGEEIYHKKCLLRPAIEGTISQFKRLMHHGKLPIRNIGRIRNAIVLMAIGINFRRLLAYFRENKPGFNVLLPTHILFLMYSVLRRFKTPGIFTMNFKLPVFLKCTNYLFAG